MTAGGGRGEEDDEGGRSDDAESVFDEEVGATATFLPATFAVRAAAALLTAGGSAGANPPPPTVKLPGDGPGQLAVRHVFQRLVEIADSVVTHVADVFLVQGARGPVAATPTEPWAHRRAREAVRGPACLSAGHVASSQDQEVRIAKYVQAGANAPLDQMITALGRIARHCAAPVLDALTEWRAPKQREADVEIAKLRRSARVPRIAVWPLRNLMYGSLRVQTVPWCGGRGSTTAWTRRLARSP